jgi:hypothetical protein
MKYYFICLQGTSDNITIVDKYPTKEDAINNLEKQAIDYVKEMQGKQQANICQQNKSLDKIAADQSLKEGLYIITSGEVVQLYQKTNTTIPGTLWNSKIMKMDKIGTFSITEFDFSEEQSTPKYQRQISTPTNNQQQLKPVNFVMQELKATIEKNKGQIKLKPVKQTSSVLSELLERYNENGGKFILRTTTTNKETPSFVDEEEQTCEDECDRDVDSQVYITDPFTVSDSKIGYGIELAQSMIGEYTQLQTVSQ